MKINQWIKGLINELKNLPKTKQTVIVVTIIVGINIVLDLTFDLISFVTPNITSIALLIISIAILFFIVIKLTIKVDELSKILKQKYPNINLSQEEEQASKTNLNTLIKSKNSKAIEATNYLKNGNIPVATDTLKALDKQNPSVNTKLWLATILDYTNPQKAKDYYQCAITIYNQIKSNQIKSNHLMQNKLRKI